MLGIILGIFSYLIILIIFAFIVLSFTLALYRGAPYTPTTPKKIEKMIGLLKIQPGEKAADLGSGDGRLVIALAKAGAEAHGFKKNPLLVLWSKYRIKKAKLQGKAFVHWKSFWKVNFNTFSCLTVFGIFYIMKDLEKKLQSELPKGARVVCNYFPFPHWPTSEKDNRLFLYKIK